MRLWMGVRVAPAHGVGGGMEQVTWTLGRGLAQRGHDVTVVTTAHPQGLTEEREGPLRVVYLPDSTWRRYQGSWWRASFERLEGDHRLEPFDAVLSQSAGCLGYLRRAADTLGLPSAVVLHGSRQSELRTAWRGARSPRGLYRLGRLGWRLPRQWARWRQAAPAVAHWMAVSEEVAAAARRELRIVADSISVLPVGVDTGRFRPDATARAEERARLGLSASVPVLALATRLEREKGVAVALSAAAAARARHPDLHLLVAGHGHDEARLRRLAARLGLEQATTFLGLVGHDHLPRVLAAADLFVLPSLCAEGAPASVVEAAAAGLPVVATDSPGTRGLVTDGVNGLLVRRGDATDLAAKTSALLADGAARAAMGGRAREKAVAAWSTAAMVDTVEDVLRRRLPSRAARP